MLHKDVISPVCVSANPSLLVIGCKVCGSIRTLPAGTAAISVTAQTTPHELSGSGV